MNPPDKPDRIINKALAGDRPAVEEAPCESGNRHVALRECLGELIGTYILVFFGVGAVHVAVLTGAYAGLWQVAAIWGVAVAMAIYATSDVSGAHINPAITVAMAAYRGFPVRKIPAYVAAQLAGAIAAAATLYALFCNMISAFEATRQIVRGESGSELSAMIYGEYSPNPGIVGVSSEVLSSLSLSQAMLAEAIGTAMLAFFVFAVTEPRNTNRSGGALVALFVGLGLAIIISIIAPLTQAGLNPARDFGPRLFSYFAGWGEIAIPGPRGGFFTVYILAPIVGALAGSGIYQYLIRPALPRRADDQVDSQMFVTRKHKVGQVKGWKGLENSQDSQTRQQKMERTRLILVGGFLGAGKTTLLAQAAERLKRQGKRVGLITNDQAANLVDTATLTQGGLPVSEVSGGCFCCHFDELVSASERLMDEYEPDVILAEPVGSCTDISATVLQPLKKSFANRFQVAPFSVLVDPLRLRELVQSNGKRAFPESVFYIFAKQLEETDLIVVNKADAVYPCEMTQLENMLWEHFPNKPVLGISALRGKGVDTWLNFVIQDKPAGQCIAEVDYDIYAISFQD